MWKLEVPHNFYRSCDFTQLIGPSSNTDLTTGMIRKECGIKIWTRVFRLPSRNMICIPKLEILNPLVSATHTVSHIPCTGEATQDDGMTLKFVSDHPGFQAALPAPYRSFGLPMGLPEGNGPGPASLMPPLHPAHHAAYLAAARSFDSSSQMRLPSVPNNIPTNALHVSKM